MSGGSRNLQTKEKIETVAFEIFVMALVRVLRRLGLNASFSGRNDVTVDGKKICGNSQKISHGRVLHHGCIMLGTDLSQIDKALKPKRGTISSRETAVGAKAIWNRDNIHRVVVTQSSPASIGFSALLGGSISVQPEDPFGAVAECTQQEPNVICALSAGVMEAFCMENVRKVPVGERLTYVMAEPGILAFDGERELMWKAGDTVEIVITMEGPRCVDIEEVLNQAQQAGYFRLKKGGEKHGQNG